MHKPVKLDYNEKHLNIHKILAFIVIAILIYKPINK